MLVKELLEQFRGSVCRPAEPHRRESGRGIVVCARKRPVSERENDAARVRTGGVLECALDAVTCRNPRVYVHEARKRVDDTQAVETTEFTFDHTFGEESDTGAVYAAVVRPLVEAAVVRGGVSTVFAYGQTGSGKTYTMTGVEAYAAADIYAFAGALEQEHRRLHYGPAAGGLEVRVAFFEIAGDRVYDLLHGRTELFVREDDAGDVHVCGLQAERAGTPEELLALIHAGSEQRCTKATFKNESSSRTHAVCQITLHALGGPEAAGTPAGTPLGKLSLVDLAGSERAGDVVHHTQERQRETIAINSSLMTLQECIRCRALEARNAATYVPFRQSKLTMLLRDSFTRDEVATAVIVTVSPLQADTQHTLSTCRFAARIKDKGPTPSSGIDKADPHVVQAGRRRLARRTLHRPPPAADSPHRTRSMPLLHRKVPRCPLPRGVLKALRYRQRRTPRLHRTPKTPPGGKGSRFRRWWRWRWLWVSNNRRGQQWQWQRQWQR